VAQVIPVTVRLVLNCCSFFSFMATSGKEKPLSAKKGDLLTYEQVCLLLQDGVIARFADGGPNGLAVGGIYGDGL